MKVSRWGVGGCWALILGAVTFVGGPRGVRGADPTAVTPVARAVDRVVVVGEPTAEVTTRLIAELRFLGFETEVVSTTGPSEPQALRALARQRDAVAAIALDPMDHRIQVSIVDRMTGKSVTRELVLSAAGSESEPREVAVRSVELLRASLVEVADQPPPPEAEMPVGDAGRRTLRPPRPRVGGGVGVAVGGAPGGVPVAVHGRIFVRYMPTPRVGVVLIGVAPLHAVEVTAPEGTARIRTGWVGAGPRVSLRPPDATVVPDLSVIVGVAIAGMEGRPAPGHSGAYSRVLDAIVEGAAGVEFVLQPRLRLRVAAAAGVCARTIRVRFSERPVATWCRPHVLGSLGVGVVLW